MNYEQLTALNYQQAKAQIDNMLLDDAYLLRERLIHNIRYTTERAALAIKAKDCTTLLSGVKKLEVLYCYVTDRIEGTGYSAARRPASMMKELDLPMNYVEVLAAKLDYGVTKKYKLLGISCQVEKHKILENGVYRTRVYIEELRTGAQHDILLRRKYNGD